MARHCRSRNRPVPVGVSGDDHIVPLHTAEEVLAEGAQMHNCVASHIPQVLANTAALYHGEVAGKPLTIQIAPRNLRLPPGEAKTFANDEPTAAQVRVLREFNRPLSRWPDYGTGRGVDAGKGRPW